MFDRPCLLALGLLLATAGAAQAQQRETISFESRQKGRPVQVTAEIYWPAAAGPVPALVIHHGSGGVSDSREGRFAREIVAMGVAAVVIDSFRPRGVSSTVQDQSAVTGQDFNLDALMALKALGANGRIDRARIGITGFSKGGTSSLMAAHEQQVVAAGVPAGLRYALHVPFYPSCSAQYYRPQTTGAPIYMLLGGADTYVGFEPCQTYGEALRTAGARVEVTVFPNAMHGFDGGRAYFDPRGENYAKCVFQQQADRSWVERASGVMTIGTDGRPIQGALAKALAVCKTLGTSGGPNDAAARQSMEDLKGYVRRHLLGG
ncbi:MAG: dienelactone hydrolase family protein [Reyranella sp.]|nr:dienelactone hydrolase family protein [Reyranella sp.]